MMAGKVTIALPYAKAIFNLAVEKRKIKEWSDFLQVMTQIAKDKQMQSFFKNPLITKQKWSEIFKEISVKMLTTEELNFLELLVIKKRLLLLPSIATLFEQFKAEYEKTMDVKIVSAYPLDKNRLDKLKLKLTSFLKREVILHCSIDDSILGGLVIYAGDQVINGSLRGKLNQLSEILYS